MEIQGVIQEFYGKGRRRKAGMGFAAGRFLLKYRSADASPGIDVEKVEKGCTMIAPRCYR